MIYPSTKSGERSLQPVAEADLLATSFAQLEAEENPYQVHRVNGANFALDLWNAFSCLDQLDPDDPNSYGYWEKAMVEFQRHAPRSREAREFINLFRIWCHGGYRHYGIRTIHQIQQSYGRFKMAA